MIDDYVNAILEAEDGALWFGTRRGVSKLDTEGGWTHYTPVDGLGGYYIWTIIQATDGAFWFGTTNGVSRYDPVLDPAGTE